MLWALYLGSTALVPLYCIIRRGYFEQEKVQTAVGKAYHPCKRMFAQTVEVDWDEAQVGIQSCMQPGQYLSDVIKASSTPSP